MFKCNTFLLKILFLFILNPSMVAVLLGCDGHRTLVGAQISNCNKNSQQLFKIRGLPFFSRCFLFAVQF